MNDLIKEAYDLHKEMIDLDAMECIELINKRFPGSSVFSHSFSMEDMAIHSMIQKSRGRIDIFTLDTGRHFEETYTLMDKVREVYPDTPFAIYFPEREDVESLVSAMGVNGFYRSKMNRLECCYIRKVRPLRRALAGKKVWITGLRREHSPERSTLNRAEADLDNGVIKVHPILDWGFMDLSEYTSVNCIPISGLYDKGYKSIGCSPCTRPLEDGEDFRAGRWWWEEDTKKECGLHTHKETESPAKGIEQR